MANPDIAYDLYVLAQYAHETHDRFDGWVFGLPPAIQPEEWPLDPANGYPLMHGFTLRLPESYRCHGPDIVAISFFGTAGDHNDGGPATNRRLAAALALDSPPEDADLRAVWQAFRHSHPRLHRMVDILDCNYAVILLTEQEFNGPFCRPPKPAGGAALAAVAPPEWLLLGSAQALNDMVYSPHMPSTPEGGVHGRVLEAMRMPFNRALKLVPRAADPNAGKAPAETYGEEPAPSGYQPHFFWEGGKIDADSYREHDWARDHAPNHLGGTMRPCQAIPDGFSPYYLEFEEYFGGFNFGTGNAQLDFKNMIFDWACG